MSDERWFHGGDPAAELDWRGPALRLGVPLEIARDLYDRATRRTADPRRVAQLYVADLRGASEAHRPGSAPPPVPGRPTRVLEDARRVDRSDRLDRSGAFVPSAVGPGKSTRVQSELGDHRSGAFVPSAVGPGKSTRVQSELGDPPPPGGAKPLAVTTRAAELALSRVALRTPVSALAAFDARARLANHGAAEAGHPDRVQRTRQEAHEVQHAAHHAVQHHHAVAHAHQHAHPQAIHAHPSVAAATSGSQAPPASHGAVQLKQIDDWSRYVPDTVSADPRERSRIAALLQHKVGHDRVIARDHLSHLHAAHVARSAAVRGREHRLHARIARARRAALVRVAAAERRQAAAVQAAFAAAQGRVHGAAIAARSTVNAAYTATVATIHREYHTAAHELADHKASAIVDITAAQLGEALLVASAFAEAHASVAARAASEARFARSMGGAVPLPYSGRQLAAARAAARQTAAQFADGLPGQVEARAQTAIFDYQPAYDGLVVDVARVAKAFVTSIYALHKQTLEAAHRRALATASAARADAIAVIDGQAVAARASLAAQGAAQVAAVHGLASAARAGIRRTARATRLAVARGSHHLAAELDRGAQAIVERARQIDVPDVEAIAQARQRGHRRLRTTVASRAKDLQDAVRHDVPYLARQATAAAAGMAAVATSGRASASLTASDAAGALHRSAGGAARHLQDLARPFGRHAHAIAQEAKTILGDLVARVRTSYTAITKQVQGMIDTRVARVDPVCKTSIMSVEVPQIFQAAANAARKAEPGWEKVLDVAAPIIVVVIVGVLTDGIGDAVLAGAEAGEAGAGLEAGAGVLGNVGRTLGELALDGLGGGLSNAAGQLVQNGTQGTPGTGGLAMSFLQGAAGGLIGGLLGIGMKLGAEAAAPEFEFLGGAVAGGGSMGAKYLERLAGTASTNLLGDILSGQLSWQNTISTVLLSLLEARKPETGAARR